MKLQNVIITGTTFIPVSNLSVVGFSGDLIRRGEGEESMTFLSKTGGVYQFDVGFRKFVRVGLGINPLDLEPISIHPYKGSEPWDYLLLSDFRVAIKTVDIKHISYFESITEDAEEKLRDSYIFIAVGDKSSGMMLLGSQFESLKQLIDFKNLLFFKLSDNAGQNDTEQSKEG